MAFYTKRLLNKNGSLTYVNDGYEYIETNEGFLFYQKDGIYRLIAYLNTNESVVLPTDIFGNSYSISGMKGVKKSYNTCW